MQLACFLLVLIAFQSHRVKVASFSAPNVARHYVPTFSHIAKVHHGTIELKSIYKKQTTHLFSGNSEEEISDENSLDNILGRVGAISQPVVWVSLYFVATTGGGLPSGPFGLLGAVEGLAYLSVVGLVIKRLFSPSSESRDILSIAENISLLTIGASLLVLASLIAQQGCIPNAKPILDYSNFVKVCNPEEVPGLFGG